MTRTAHDTPGDPLAVTAAERRRIFEDAQRQADTVFAQYQLSQLVALGGELPVMARSVIGELVRVTDAVAGAMWLATPPQPHLHVVATEPDALLYPEAVAVPERFATLADAEAWVRPSGWHGVVLDERREIGDDEPGARIIGFIALRPPEGEALPPDRVRLLALVRHELAIAFRAAQLRQTLAGEQALLAAIFDGANDGIVAVDDQRRVVRVNRAAWSLLGGRRSVGAETCRDLLGCGEPLERGQPHGTAPAEPHAGAATGEPALRCGRRCRFDEVLEGPSGIVDAEMRLVRVDGSDIPVAASFSAMAGRETGAVVVLRDLRAELAAEELRASFLAAVSHELRTPLALIGGYVDSILALDLDAAAQRRSVERIGSAATRLNVLVDELLDLTRLEQASMGLRRTRVDLTVLLETFTADLGETPGMPPVRPRPAARPAARRRRLPAHRARPDEPRRQRPQVRRSGARDDLRPPLAAPRRDHRGGHRAGHPRRRALARVRPLLSRSSGEGREHPGQRPRPLRLPPPGGGPRRPDLGGAGCGPERHLVQPSARPVRARARRSMTKGSRARHTPDGRRLVPPPVAAGPDLPGHGELILIVEDEPEFRELVELWVTRHGWRTAIAVDGSEAIRRFAEEEPALVLLDLNLPGIDGWQVTEWIRGLGSTPVLMVTALDAEQDVVRGLVAGADDYLTKPISFPELIARITAALRRARLGSTRTDDEPLVFEGLRIEPGTPRVTGETGDVHLTPTEFRLLLTLARRKDRLVSHAELLRSVWGPTYGEETQLLRVTMRNLRAKLAIASPGRSYIVTEYGLGYRFSPGA